MNHRNRKYILIFNGLAEVLLVICAYLLALFVRFRLMEGFMAPQMVSPQTFLLLVIYGLGLSFFFYVFRIYDYRHIGRYYGKIVRIISINLIGLLMILAFLFLVHLDRFSRVALFFFWGFATFFSILKCVCVERLAEKRRFSPENKRHVIVLGNGRLAKQYIDYVQGRPELGVVIDGYISKVEKKELGKSLGAYENTDQIVSEHKPDELVVALDSHETRFMEMAFRVADKEGIGLNLIPFYNEYYPSRPTIERFGESNLINMRATPLDDLLRSSLKRLFDIIGSLLLILLFSPVMLFVAIGVKLSSPGPVLFKQERVGLNKKPFQMLKFRSMRVNDKEDSGWTTDADPRKTKFGSFIRKYSLDELPQFFNVLWGDMSLVGPRPEIPYYVRHFKEEVPRYLVRQQVRPGITGWAQVNGLRGDTSIEERVKYDIWYIENWSFWLDIRILFMTAFGGMRNNEKIVGK